MQKYLLFLLAFNLSLTVSFSQKNKIPLPEMEWGKVAPSDLRMKVWATDSTAEAAILGDFGQMTMVEGRDRLNLQFRRHFRLKILNKKAFDQANIRIVFYTKDDYEGIKSIRAQTILPDGSKIPVDRKNMVKEKLDDKYSVQKFTFPAVTEGAILEYEMEMVSQNLFQLKEWEFQRDIPTRFSFLNLDLESRFSYQYLFQGKSNLKTTDVVYEKDDNGNPSRMHASFYVLDLPAIKEEAFVSTTDNYTTKIKFQLSEYYDHVGSKNKVMPTWEKTAPELLDEDKLGKMYLKKSRFDLVWEKVKPLIGATDSVMQKINILYDWVNENVEWNDKLRFMADVSPNELMKKRRGSSAEINLTLIALLREAGVEANPVLLSTRENGLPYMDYPFLDQFNHVVGHVNLDGKVLLLDCGNALRPPGILRQSALNGRGWLLKKKDFGWLTITAPPSTEIASANLELTEDGKLKGSIKYQYKGNVAAEKRGETNGDESGKDLKAAFAKKFPDWNIDSVTYKNLKDAHESLEENLFLTINNAAQINDNLLYFKPILHSNWEVNPFKNPQRFYPVEFPYPTSEQFVLNVKIPKGYKVEELPKAINLVVPPEDARFQYFISEKEGVIGLMVKISVKKTNYPADEYPFLKRFFDDIAAKLNEQIVLKKVD